LIVENHSPLLYFLKVNNLYTFPMILNTFRRLAALALFSGCLKAQQAAGLLHLVVISVHAQEAAQE
jgi:hypothetical protein